MLFRTFIFLGCLTWSLLGELNILMPQKLKEWWDQSPQQTHTSIAAFGHIPWGKKILGSLELAYPNNACDYIHTQTEDTTTEPILVAVRGDCPFYLKAHYAQLAGAQMLIIVDNQYEDVETKLMVDSAGQGESIHIPSVLLAKTGGDKIIESLKTKDATISNIHVVYDFKLPKNDKVEYHIWISSSSTQTFRFLKDWKQYQDKLSSVTTMQPHFAHFKMSMVPLAQDPNDRNCICGGRYCGTDPDGDLPNTGKDVILEDLRQMCLIYEYGIDTWWQYISNYNENCLMGGEMSKCSKDIMVKIQTDPDRINNCVKRSFIGSNDPGSCTANKFLDEEADALSKDGVFIFPSVFINGFMYRGNLVPSKGLFEAVCESFNTLPSACEDHFDAPAVVVNETKHWPIILATTGFLLIFGLFVFCCYKRHLKREMYRQMVRDVNIAVSQYIAFKDDDIGKAEETNE